jgi:hypothetical protein
MPGQENVNAVVPSPDVIEQPVQIAGWRCLVAVPPAYRKPVSPYRYPSSPDRVLDRPGDRNHPEHGEVYHGDGPHAHLTAAMQDHDDACWSSHLTRHATPCLTRAADQPIG